MIRQLQIFSVLLFFLAVISVNCETEDSLKQRWLTKDLSKQEGKKLVELSKKKSFKKIAPALLEIITTTKNVPPNISPYIKRPWEKQNLSDKHKKYIMARRVWSHHIDSEKNSSKANILLELLQKESKMRAELMLIHAISMYHWSSKAEKTLSKMARSNIEPLDIREASVNALLNHSKINTYIPISIKIIRKHKTGPARAESFTLLTNLGGRIFNLNKKNRRVLISTGFQILRGLPKENHHGRYFVARRLGYVLKVKNEFSPDQTREKYQGKNGLKKSFFTDTVENALRWYEQNWREKGGN